MKDKISELFKKLLEQLSFNMKDKISELFKKLVSDRYFFMLIIIMMLQTLFLSVLLGFSISTNDRQLISNYSAFGGTHFYFSQWYYLFAFVVFGLIAALIHTAIAIKCTV